MDNERRADLGRDAIHEAGAQTRVVQHEQVATCITDVLAYIAHFCDRCGIDPAEAFRGGLISYEGDMEDGPRARPLTAGEVEWWSDLPPVTRTWGAG